MRGCRFPTPRALRVRAKSTECITSSSTMPSSTSWSKPGGFLEWARVHENRYGTPRARVEEHMAKGGQVLLEIDVQGGFQIREQIPEAHLVFIEPPSLEVLESRLRGRGTDSEESIAVRMKNAQVELSHKMEYDKQFVNDDLEACTDELVAYIESQAKMCEE